MSDIFGTQNGMSVKALNTTARILEAAADDLDHPDPHGFAEKYANLLALEFGPSVINAMASGHIPTIAVAVKMCFIIEDPGVKEDMMESYEDARAKAYAMMADMGLTREDVEKMQQDELEDDDL